MRGFLQCLQELRIARERQYLDVGWTHALPRKRRAAASLRRREKSRSLKL
jgi:hypothetical protein